MIKLNNPYVNKIRVKKIEDTVFKKNKLINDVFLLSASKPAMLVISEVAICDKGKANFSNLVLNDPSSLHFYSKLVEVMDNEEVIPAIELIHAGRKTSHLSPVGISALKYSKESKMPEVLTYQELDVIIQKFIKSCILAQKAGFKAVVINAADGYILHQLLCPLTNNRQDHYKSGDLFIYNLLRNIKKYCDLDIILKVPVTDYVAGGIKIENITNLINSVKKFISFVEISSGGNFDSVEMPKIAGYNLDMAAYVKVSCEVKVITSGKLTSPEMVEYALYTEKTDAIIVSDLNDTDPYYVKKLKDLVKN